MPKQPNVTAATRITIAVESRPRISVLKSDYVRAKTGDLRNFGYANLNESEVEKQLDLLLAGKKWTDVIGGFIEHDKPKKV